MKIQKWESLSLANGLPMVMANKEPCGFVPIFSTKKDALKWTKGDESHIFEMKAVEARTEKKP